MSTRCNIVVSYGSSKIYLYRHCDGYAAETGADIVTKLQSKPDITATTFIGDLLAERYNATSYDPVPREVYEVTTDIHGDIEWLYAVRFSEARMHGKLCELAFREIKIGDDAARTMVGLSFGPVDALIHAANKDRADINARMAQRKAEQPTFAYEPYPMLALPLNGAPAAPPGETATAKPLGKMKIGEIREVIDGATWTRNDLTGGTSSEFRAQPVGQRLLEKVAALEALVIPSRFADDDKRRTEEIARCQAVIARWNAARS